MIYPIVIYGSPVLRNETKEISPDYPDVKKLVDDMYATMYNADGVGLAAPQIGLSIRLFVVDASPLEEDFPECKGFRRHRAKGRGSCQFTLNPSGTRT